MSSSKSASQLGYQTAQLFLEQYPLVPAYWDKKEMAEIAAETIAKIEQRFYQDREMTQEFKQEFIKIFTKAVGQLMSN